MAIIVTQRNPNIHYEFARENNVSISTVIETHPPADFVGSQLQMHK